MTIITIIIIIIITSHKKQFSFKYGYKHIG